MREGDREIYKNILGKKGHLFCSTCLDNIEKKKGLADLKFYSAISISKKKPWLNQGFKL